MVHTLRQRVLHFIFEAAIPAWVHQAMGSGASWAVVATHRVGAGLVPVGRQWSDASEVKPVFSHESKLGLISQAQSLGFQVALYVVSLDDPKRLLARVSQRVAGGGHHDPPDRILQRYPRTMANLKTAVWLANVAYIFDAVEAEHGAHRLVALCEREQTTWLADNPPASAVAMLAID